MKKASKKKVVKKVVAGRETRADRTVKVLVTLETKKGALPKKRAMDYIRDAVEDWGGQFHSDDLLYADNIKRVTVNPKV